MTRSPPYTLGSSEIAEMGEAKHTPTPWTASEMEMSRADWAALNPAGETLYIVKRGSDVIAAVWAEDGVEEKANAEFIIRACNAHDDLVAALKRARDKLHKCIIFSGSDKEYADTCCEGFDAALAKAESRP